MEYTRRVSVAQIREGIECFVHIGELLGKDNLFYIGAMEGIDQKMNMEFEKYLLTDPCNKTKNIEGGNDYEPDTDISLISFTKFHNAKFHSIVLWHICNYNPCNK